MWKWTCPKSPGVNEHHSLKQLNETLTAHERGVNVRRGLEVPGFRRIKACKEIHDYWDDGRPCEFQKFTGKRCTFTYIPDPNGPDVDFVD
jgi:hypothetical protein